MYPSVPFEGLSWPITQHAGVISEPVLRGLLEACSLCIGKSTDDTIINEYLVKKGLLTANIRADSQQPDAWRDYQQILSELGLIFSTTVSREVLLTPIAIAFVDGAIAYEEVLTLQLLKYQYPNGHKTQISPSLRDSFAPGTFNYKSVTDLQVKNGIRIRPAVLIWMVLYELLMKGEKPYLSVDEMQRYVVRCINHDDTSFCVEAIIESRKKGIELPPLQRARRNVQDWMKLLNNTPLFFLSHEALWLSEYSLSNQDELLRICQTLCRAETFWFPVGEDYKWNWFATYGNIDLRIGLIPTSTDKVQKEDQDSEMEEEKNRFIDGRDVNLIPFTEINHPVMLPQERGVISAYDYSKSERGRNLHDSMVNLIAQKCISKGAMVYSDPKTVDLCIKYREYEYLVEVKSITSSNFINRLRYAIGQVHQYNHLLPNNGSSNRRLALGFAAEIPADSWSIPFVIDYLAMDLLTLQSSKLHVCSRVDTSYELFG